MCGISGVTDFSASPDPLTVERMTGLLAHRGPDMAGLERYPACVLGHRRLSIIDLSDMAKQPMISEETGVALVFNGEIYNYRELRKDLESQGFRFRTHSDTEVLLRLYEHDPESMLTRVNGMFSFAIWDEARRRLMLARDRLGKKPLYYYVKGSRLAFASELRSLMADPACPTAMNEQSLCEYLLYDFIPAPDTILRDVRKLPAGHVGFFDANGFGVRRYWSPPLPEPDTDYESAKTRLEELLTDAVRLRLIADVPLGAFLSGGVDSTLVSALMKSAKAGEVKTFSIAFPGTSHDESPWARRAAAAIGTAHYESSVEYDIVESFPAMVRHFGEPFGDSSAVPTRLLSERTREHVTVALSGDGGDELFAGYERYVARRLQSVYEIAPELVRRRVIEPIVDTLPETTNYYGTSIVKKAKLFLRASRRLRENPFALIPRTFGVEETAGLTGISYSPEQDPVIDIARGLNGLSPVEKMLFADLQTYLAEDILTKVDRMSMAHALEVRSPLLDYRVVEFACRLPLHYKLRGLTTKRILKDIARRYIAAGIVDRKKYGFQVPVGRWFKTGLKDWAQERLFDPGQTLFDKTAVRNVWDEHQSGSADNGAKLWLLLVADEWRRSIG